MIRDQILALADTGMKHAEIAAIVGCSKGYVCELRQNTYRWENRRAPAMPRYRKTDRTRRPYTAEDVAEIGRLAEAGFSQSAIAEALGRSAGSMHGKIAKLGIPTSGGPGGTPSHRKNR